MTCSAKALRARSGPTMASTRSFCSHCSRFLLAFESCSSKASTSSSLPSKSQAMRTLPLTLPAPTTTAPWKEPSYWARTLVPTSCTVVPPTLTPPAAFPRGRTEVPRGSQKARQPQASSSLLRPTRLTPATVETAAVGTRTMEQHSSSSSGISAASPKGPACGTSCVTMARARRRSSPSPPTKACLPRTSTIASEAVAIFERWRAQAPPSAAGSSRTSMSKPKSEPRGCGGERSAKWPATLRSTAAMAWNLAAVRGRRSPMRTRRPCVGAGRGTCAAALRFEGRTSTAGSSASPPPSHSTSTVPSAEKPCTLAWNQESS
mmetsp:Transcript_16986/g.53542  ORF Transcript_16986/g.53542 Transcript_16986/m.53542 type:complete len:319 (+) Transcript_16986:979-1935(+)